MRTMHIQVVLSSKKCLLTETQHSASLIIHLCALDCTPYAYACHALAKLLGRAIPASSMKPKQVLIKEQLCYCKPSVMHALGIEGYACEWLA